MSTRRVCLAFVLLSAVSAGAALAAPPAIQAWTNLPGGEIRIGDPLEIVLRPSADGWAYVVHADGSGEVALLLPGASAADNRVSADRILTLPDRQRGVLRATGPAGTDTLIVLLASRQIDLAPHLGILRGPPGRNPDVPAFLAAVEKATGLDRSRDLAHQVLAVKVIDPGALASPPSITAPSPTASPSVGAGAATTAVTVPPGHVLALQVAEAHADTFPAPFELEPPGDPVEPPFWIESGQVRVLPHLMNETDPAKLAKHRLELSDPARPLAACQVLVTYSVSYGGKGRRGGEARYLAIPRPGPLVPVPAPVLAIPGLVEYDLERSGGTLGAVVRGVRVLPEKQPGIGLALEAERRLRVDFAGRSLSVEPGKRVPLASGKRTVPVVQLAAASQPIGGGPAEEVLPRVDHGPIEFGSELSIEWQGTLPVAPAAPEGEGGDL